MLVVALVMLPVVGVLLRLSGVAGTRRALGLRGNRATATGAAIAVVEAQRVARIVEIAARRGAYHARCLEKSLLLESLLLRRGIDCELKFGLRVDDNPLAAHAWVECGGQALADPGSEDHAIRVFY